VEVFSFKAFFRLPKPFSQYNHVCTEDSLVCNGVTLQSIIGDRISFSYNYETSKVGSCILIRSLTPTVALRPPSLTLEWGFEAAALPNTVPLEQNCADGSKQKIEVSMADDGSSIEAVLYAVGKFEEIWSA
jgi:hypothetical protein